MRKLNKTFFFLPNSFLGFWRCNRGASGPEGWWQTGHSHTETEGLWDPNTARPGVLQVHLCLSFYTQYTNIVQLNICWQSHFASPEQMNRLSLKKKPPRLARFGTCNFIAKRLAIVTTCQCFSFLSLVSVPPQYVMLLHISQGEQSIKWSFS